MMLRIGDMLPRANVGMHDKTQTRMIDENIQIFFFTSVIFLFLFFFTFPLTFDFSRLYRLMKRPNFLF